MENYMKNYKIFTKEAVYVFKTADGGIGDNIKFFLYALDLCMKHNVRLCYLRSDILIESYLKLVNNSMYISNIETSYTFVQTSIQDLKSNQYTIISPYMFYSTFNYDTVSIPYDNVFTFSNRVIEHSKTFLLPTKYDSIHLRLGDKFLETDMSYVICKDDVRDFNQNALFEYIESNSTSPIIFFCDNNAYKTFLKLKYPFLHVLPSSIGHTGLQNTTEAQILDTVTEFYILTQSSKIIVASKSGFSIVASKFKQIPILYI
jgi:hypothetical protein